MKLVFNLFDYIVSIFKKSKLNDDVLKRCETEGFNASASGKSQSSNPYPVGSSEHADWNAGFWVW